jgi:hypothetical protein
VINRDRSESQLRQSDQPSPSETGVRKSLVMKGVDLLTVQTLTGHSGIKTTMIHAQLASDHLSDAVDKLEF